MLISPLTTASDPTAALSGVALALVTDAACIYACMDPAILLHAPMLTSAGTSSSSTFAPNTPAVAGGRAASPSQSTGSTRSTVVTHRGQEGGGSPTVSCPRSSMDVAPEGTSGAVSGTGGTAGGTSWSTGVPGAPSFRPQLSPFASAGRSQHGI